MTKTKLGSVGLSVALFIALIVWMATGDVRVANDQAPSNDQSQQTSLPAVEIETRRSQLYEPSLMLQGQLEPWQSVRVSARVPGTVKDLMARQGDRVAAGEALLAISADGRETEVARWQAQVRKLQADLSAAQRLRARELASQSQLLTLESQLAEARAELTRAELAIDYLRPRAPFAGTVNARFVEEGDLLQTGSELFELVRIDRLKAVSQVSQQAVSQVDVGQPARIETLDGDTLSGKVIFIASAASSQTRSFAVEIAVENPDSKRLAGASATLRIALPAVQAMFVSPAFLSLGDDGRPGLRHVNDDDEVVFSTVRLLSITTEGAWVTGLPDEIRLITRGASFVSIGQQVQPVSADLEQG